MDYCPDFQSFFVELPLNTCLLLVIEDTCSSGWWKIGAVMVSGQRDVRGIIFFAINPTYQYCLS